MLKKLLVKLYGTKSVRIRGFVRWLILRTEGGEYYSTTLRECFRKYHGVEIGMYSHGGCFRSGQIDRHTKIGRYCSIATTARTHNRNHPLERKSTHAFFFNPRLGYCEKDSVEHIPLEIGNDVWIGHNAIVMPNVRVISDGAVIAAGAVVNKDVPPYGVVVGNPGRVVRFRFSPEVIRKLQAEKWWDKPVGELMANRQEYFNDYETVDKSTAPECAV